MLEYLTSPGTWRIWIGLTDGDWQVNAYGKLECWSGSYQTSWRIIPGLKVTMKDDGYIAVRVVATRTSVTPYVLRRDGREYTTTLSPSSLVLKEVDHLTLCQLVALYAR